MDKSEDWLARNWRLHLFLAWIAICAWFVFSKWAQIHWFSLGDTDDNMRMMQVRAWLNGQGWYDLRQYRMDPPGGANIHWSRLVDLPIAGLILAARPFIGGAGAEKFAIAVAPMIPLGAMLAGLGLAVRRLVAPGAPLISAGIAVSYVTLMLMFQPTRIDHHGWQLAMLAWLLAGLADPQRGRGGATVGAATALSLVIGMEMLIWLAVAGAGVVLRWMIAADEAKRLRAYGLALGGGTALGYLIFASEANRVPRCDALTPVWLSTMVVAGAVLFALSFLKIERAALRIAAAGVAGAALAAFFVIAWPDCLGRPEQVSPEMQRLWLDNISEAKPLFTQSWATILSVSVLLIGLGGSLWQVWRNRASPLGAAWATIALLAIGSSLLLLWQTRTAAAALLFTIPGATALAWAILPRMRAHPSMLVRVFGTVAAFLLISGLGFQLIIGMLPNEGRKPGLERVNKANASCPTLPSLKPIALLPKATILTGVDLGPRLITVTHHSAIAGPYHRNEAAVLDIHKAFRGQPADALDVMKRHGATLLAICPDTSETTIYRAQAPKGFYMQLANGQVPAWLTPVPMPARSPWRVWRLAQ